jgi:hypothetical protein
MTIPPTTWTVTTLQDLETAIGSGARRIRYDDIDYVMHDLPEIERLRRRIQKDLGLRPRGRVRRVVAVDKGV